LPFDQDLGVSLRGIEGFKQDHFGTRRQVYNQVLIFRHGYRLALDPIAWAGFHFFIQYIADGVWGIKSFGSSEKIRPLARYR
jgi:hypothetical protein